MKKLILLLTVGMLYTAQAQHGQHVETLLILSPEKGGLQIKLNFDNERLLVSDSAQKRFKIMTPEGKEFKYNTATQSKRDFRKFVKWYNENPYLTLHIAPGHRFSWRVYKYRR